MAGSRLPSCNVSTILFSNQRIHMLSTCLPESRKSQKHSHVTEHDQWICKPEAHCVPSEFEFRKFPNSGYLSHLKKVWPFHSCLSDSGALSQTFVQYVCHSIHSCIHQGDRRLFLLNFIHYKTMRFRSDERHQSGNTILPWPALAICRSARLEFEQWLVSERVDPSWAIWVNQNEICRRWFPFSFG